MEIIQTILKGILLFLANPLFYLVAGALFLVGARRVQGERLSFGVKIYGALNHIIGNVTAGLVAGLLVTVITASLGLSLPYGMLVLITVVYVLLMATTQLRFVTATLSVGLATIAAFLMPEFSLGVGLLDSWIQDIHQTSFRSLGLLLVLSGLLEGILILWKGHRMSSPRLINSKRGKQVGAHDASHLWPVPFLFFIPGAGNIPSVGWWPLTAGDQFGLVLFPMVVSLQQLIVHNLTEGAVKASGRWMLLVTAITGLTVGAGIYLGIEWLVVIAAVVLVSGRLMLVWKHHYDRENQPFFYTHEENGLRVVAVIPGTPAEKMGVRPGEAVKSVNGRRVDSEAGFYEALQINGAFCRMELLDYQGEVRLAKTAVHEGIHHKIGLLFLEPSKRMAPRENIY